MNRLVAVYMLIIGSLMCFTIVQAAEKSPYRLEGRFMDAETQTPIAHAALDVIVLGEQDPAVLVRHASSDENGKYCVELPIGHAELSFIRPPPGYCEPEKRDSSQLATTEAEPVVTRDYQLRRGVAFAVAVRTTDGGKLPPQSTVAFGLKPGSRGLCRLTDRGEGIVTVPKGQGEYTIVWGDKREFKIPEAMQIRVDDGFDPQYVLADLNHPKEGVTEIRDQHGKTAQLQGCEAEIAKEALTIVIPVMAKAAADDKVKPALRGRVRGQITDAGAMPLAGATVRLYFHLGGIFGGKEVATSDASGIFSLELPPLRPAEKISFLVMCEGYANLETPPRLIAFPEESAVDVGMLSLLPSASIRIRVVDTDGNPAQGAVVQPTLGLASFKNAARTDENGECVLSGLPEGQFMASARLGALFGQLEQFDLGPGRNDTKVIKLQAAP